MGLSDIRSSALTCAQILIAVFMFAWSLPRKTPEAGRAAGTACFFVAWVFVMASLMPSVISNGESVKQALIFAVTLAMCCGLVLFVFDASVWAALFCASAGYTMQNLASSIGSLCIESFPALNTAPLRLLLTMVIPYATVYLACYMPLVSKVRRDGLELIRPQVALPLIIVVIFAVICFDVVVKGVSALGISPFLVIGCRAAHVTLCALVLVLEYETLYNRRLLEEVAAVSRTMEAEREQYALSKETIEAINLKCHDIRHQIRRLGSEAGTVDPAVLDDIAREVNVYDSSVRTGNEPLDVILTEKSLVCDAEGIALSCIADGSALGFMAPSDLYSLVGNALDNAIEAVSAIEDRGRRSVSVVIRRAANMVTVHVENYYLGPLEFKDGLPQTRKADKGSHGYGMKSMRLVAARYGGALHVRTQGDVFHLNVVIPVP